MFFGYIDRTLKGVPFYVGIGNDARRKNFKRNQKHKNVRAKHGVVREPDAFVTSSWEAAQTWEIATIAELHTFINDPLANSLACNMTLGGEGRLGNHSGHTTLGRKMPKISAALRGRRQTPEERAKRSVAMKGRERPDISALLKGRSSPLKGRPWSTARRAAQRNKDS